MLQDFFRISLVEEGSETNAKMLIVISILSKNLFKLHDLFMEKFRTAANGRELRTWENTPLIVGLQ